MKKTFLILLVLPLLMGAGCSKQNQEIQMIEKELMQEKPNVPAVNDNTNEEVTEEVKFEQTPYSHSGELTDVSGGQSTGVASALFSDMSVVLHAEFQNLPELSPNHFYEGWLVRQEPFAFISTGATTMGSIAGHHSNDFVAVQDLEGYDFYVLTLEPDDGDPAPAEHIIEGKMNRL